MIQLKKPHTAARPGDPIVITNTEFAHLLVVLYIHESWRPVPQFPGYEISSHGRIKGKNGGIVKQYPMGHKGRGRLSLKMRRNGKAYNKYSHRILLESFVGPCPQGMESCHWDDNCFHNHLWNLRWDTRLSNSADKIRNGRTYRGSRHHQSKTTEPEVVEIRRLREEGCTYMSLAKLFGLSETLIRLIVDRKVWKHV